MTDCGQSLLANEGYIEYSLGEMYAPRLRCGFVIRTRNHSGFIFTLEENGLTLDPLIAGGPIHIFSFNNEGLMDHANL